MTLSQQHPGLMLPIQTVQLTQGQATIIDPEDWPAVSQYHWTAILKANGWYARRRLSPSSGGTRSSEYLHTFLTGFAKTDHENGNGLDNRRVNLRPAAGNNAKNCFSSRNSTSIYKGVSWEKRRNKWQALITSERIPHFLGYFDNDIDAALAYDTAARIYHREFGRYNFPAPGEQPAVKGGPPPGESYAQESRPGTSQFKGVSWDRPREKWRACIKIHQAYRNLGRFASENEAALAYDAAARLHYGAYGRYNFPEPGEQPAVPRMPRHVHRAGVALGSIVE